MNGKVNEYLTRQHMLSNNYEIFHYSDRNLNCISSHCHDFYEFYFLISGDVTYQVNEREYNLIPGDMILINSKEFHQVFINNKEASYERIVFWIGSSFLKELSTKETNLALCFENTARKNIIRGDLEEQNDIKKLLWKLLNLQGYKGIGYDLLYRSYISELMVFVNNLAFNNKLLFGANLKNNSMIDEIIEYINNNINEDITIDKISECFYISKFHLSREFKKHTGATIHRYITRKKLIEAKKLLLKETPIINIYKQCGFGDYSNFFRAFKNEYGVTPKQFYRSMINDI